MEDADAALARERDREPRLGDRVHRGGDDGDAQLDRPCQPRSRRDVVRQHARLGGDEEHVVEREPFLRELPVQRNEPLELVRTDLDAQASPPWKHKTQAPPGRLGWETLVAAVTLKYGDGTSLDGREQPRRTHGPNTCWLASSRCGRCSRRWLSRLPVCIRRRPRRACRRSTSSRRTSRSPRSRRTVRTSPGWRRAARLQRRPRALAGKRRPDPAAGRVGECAQRHLPLGGRPSGPAGAGRAGRQRPLDAAGAGAGAVRLRARSRLHRPAGAALRRDRARQERHRPLARRRRGRRKDTRVRGQLRRVRRPGRVPRRRLVPAQADRGRHPRDRRPGRRARARHMGDGRGRGRTATGSPTCRRPTSQATARRSRRRAFRSRSATPEPGRWSTRIVPRGVPDAVALSGSVLATLERSALGLRVAWYNPSNGTPLGSVPVPKDTSPELSAGGRLIVFRVGRSIRSVDIDSHAVQHADEGGSDADRSLRPGQPRRVGREHRRPRTDPRALRRRARLI